MKPVHLEEVRRTSDAELSTWLRQAADRVDAGDVVAYLLFYRCRDDVVSRYYGPRQSDGALLVIDAQRAIANRE